VGDEIKKLPDPKLLSEWELWACANQCIRQHQLDAPIFAAMRADKLLEPVSAVVRFRTASDNIANNPRGHQLGRASVMMPRWGPLLGVHLPVPAVRRFGSCETTALQCDNGLTVSSQLELPNTALRPPLAHGDA